MLSLKEFRSRIRGLPDLLNYAALVDEGIMLNKDGSLLSAFYFRGEDLDSATTSELEMLSVQVNAALRKLGSGWLLNVDSMRISASMYPSEDESHFPYRICSLIDEERRAQYQEEGAHFENIFALTLTYLSPPDIQRKFTSIFVDDDLATGSKKTASHTDILGYFKNALTDICDSLSSYILMRPMNSTELLTFLHTTITGDTHPVRIPSIPMYMDKVLASRDFFTGLKPRMGNKHLRVITIAGFPSNSSPGILDSLNKISIEYRWATRFIAMDQSESQKKISIFRRNWTQKRTGLMALLKSAMTGNENQGWQDNDAASMALDSDNAKTAVSSGAVRFGYYTSVIVIFNEDLAAVESQAREVSKLLGGLGFSSFIEEINSVEAFLGSLPGHAYPNVRKPLIHTLNLADLLPLTSIWAGPEVHPCPFYPPDSPPLMYAATSGATPFRISLHVGDVGHTLIVGPTGAGKSTLLSFIMAQQFRYKNAQIFCFDRGFSSYVGARAGFV